MGNCHSSKTTSTSASQYLYNITHHIDSVCLFVWSLSSHSRIFHAYGDVTITDEGLQILTYARQWGFFNVPHLLWHGPSLYNLRGPVTLTPVAERFAVELSQPVFTTKVCRDRGSNPDLLHARRTLYIYATTAVD